MTSTPLPGSEPTSRPPLLRSRTDMMLGGVSGGLAAHTGVDALLWRVAFVGLTLAGGAGIPIYLALWVLVPPAPAGPADRTNLLDEWVERLRNRLSSDRPSPAAG
jgi:phage shock protein PspC (stress-responsive transcriptional regulator)